MVDCCRKPFSLKFNHFRFILKKLLSKRMNLLFLISVIIGCFCVLNALGATLAERTSNLKRSNCFGHSSDEFLSDCRDDYEEENYKFGSYKDIDTPLEFDQYLGRDLQHDKQTI
ncbi:hypothetical protein AKO1_006265 [Acrasis kona]|uniref:Uncharacterized protein n=1 Tax=Acrasis kona TaxID=1008807 RepID=A0AAW2YGQ9_9EUKA